MQLCFLHFDDALARQKDFRSYCEAKKLRQIDLKEAGQHVRLWGTNHKLMAVASSINNFLSLYSNDNPRLCFIGSGDFHHITALLVTAAAQTATENFTVIHFDNHPDWVRFFGGMHCGSWVNKVAAENKVAKVITLGLCSDDLKKKNKTLLSGGKVEIFPWESIEKEGRESFTKTLLSRITTKNIYITIDKDVLSQEYCASNWDQGNMPLSYMLSLLRTLGHQHKIIGADVTGDYSRPLYGGNLITRILKKAEVFIDQTPALISETAAAKLNGDTNQLLADAFLEVMP